VESLSFDILPGLKQSLHRHLAHCKQFVETIEKFTAERETKVGLDVSDERPKPVPLSLAAELPKAPHTVSYPMTKTVKDNPHRHVVSWPVTKRTQPVDTSAIGTVVSLQTKRRFVSLEITVYIPVAPDPAAATAFLQTSRRSRKGILTAPLEKLLDPSHEKQQQYKPPWA
jgi:hypothetical protein